MAYTFMEPLPVGLIITLISAAVLRRKAQVKPNPAPAVINRITKGLCVPGYGKTHRKSQ